MVWYDPRSWFGSSTSTDSMATMQDPSSAGIGPYGGRKRKSRSKTAKGGRKRSSKSKQKGRRA